MPLLAPVGREEGQNSERAGSQQHSQTPSLQQVHKDNDMLLFPSCIVLYHATMSPFAFALFVCGRQTWISFFQLAGNDLAPSEWDQLSDMVFHLDWSRSEMDQEHWSNQRSLPWSMLLESRTEK